MQSPFVRQLKPRSVVSSTAFGLLMSKKSCKKLLQSFPGTQIDI